MIDDGDLQRVRDARLPVTIVDLRVVGPVTYYQSLGGQLADAAVRFAYHDREWHWPQLGAWNLTIAALCECAVMRARIL